MNPTIIVNTIRRMKMRSKDTRHEEYVARLEQKVKDQERIIKELREELDNAQTNWGFNLWGDDDE